jgi:hypothetical protein
MFVDRKSPVILVLVSPPEGGSLILYTQGIVAEGDRNMQILSIKSVYNNKRICWFLNKSGHMAYLPSR